MLTGLKITTSLGSLASLALFSVNGRWAWFVLFFIGAALFSFLEIISSMIRIASIASRETR